jgi:hypothetical protein
VASRTSVCATSSPANACENADERKDGGLPSAESPVTGKEAIQLSYGVAGTQIGREESTARQCLALLPWVAVPMYFFLQWKIHEATWSEEVCCGLAFLAILASDVRSRSGTPLLGPKGVGAGWLLLAAATAASLYAGRADTLYLRFVPLFIIAGLHLVGCTGSSLRALGKSLLTGLILVSAWEPARNLVMAWFGPAVARWTTASAGYILYLFGADAISDGAKLAWGAGALAVSTVCTCIPLVSSTIRMVTAEALFNRRELPYRVFPMLAISGFLVSSCRMILLVAVAPNPARFRFWHEGFGSPLVTFSFLGIVLLLLRHFYRPRTRT